MKKKSSPYFEEKFSFSFFKERRWLTSCLSIIAGVTVLIVYLQSGPKPEAYVFAEDVVDKWSKSLDDESYREMKSALKKVPELEKKYEAVIAQKLFEKDLLEDALNLAEKSLKRIEFDAPYHAAYGQTTLLIAQGAYQDALEKSVGLKEQMKSKIVQEELVGGLILYAHNLVRIACLQQELNNRPGERSAWEDLESFLGEKETISRLVFEGFKEKGLDLSNYIAERKKHL